MYRMGSQTIEILRQGVWASLTGGYFYDPHQTVSCNAIHLYLWLFLLCSPFITYLYFAKTIETWTVYCISTAITLVTVKIINLSLHVMYDEAQIVSEGNSKKSDKGLQETSGNEDGGIELQEFGNGSTAGPMSRTSIENNNDNNKNNNNLNNDHSNDLSQANSAISIEYPDQFSSTIDLKVDVHRKNSSESSDAKDPENILDTVKSAPIEHRLKRKSAIKLKSKSEDSSAIILVDSKELRSVDEGDLLSRSEERQDKFHDIENVYQPFEHSKKRLRNKLQRQTSLDSSGSDLKNFPVRRPVSSNHLHRNHGCGYYHPNLPSLTPEIYLEPNYTTKSELAIEMPTHDRFTVAIKKTPMRKDSTSTMSAIQLPTTSNNPGPSGLSSRQRRHSQQQQQQQQQQQSQLPSGIISMRRIKSTALEKCCPQPSYSNLSPHPNSVETINGRTVSLRNPPHAILPPPSATLVRNQHLNFFPKCGSIEPVYPIAEIVDEKSLNESYLISSESDDDNSDDDDDDDDVNDDDNDSEDDDNDENNYSEECAKEVKKLPSKAKSMVTISERRRHKRSQENDNNEPTIKSTQQLGCSSDTERPRTQSTDSENEINTGSQSPLLDTRSKPTIFSSTPKPECDTKTKTGSKSFEPNSNEPMNRSPNENNSNNLDDLEEGAVGGMEIPESTMIINIPTTNTKSEDSGCPSSDCEQASASSKDMLLSKNSKSSTSDRHWRDFNMDANSISVDVTETSENQSNSKQKSNDELTTIQASNTAKESSKSLGAIPKAHCSKYDSNDDNSHRCKSRSELSQASSSNSLSGASCNSLNSLNQNVLQVMRQTDDGWVLHSAASNNPYLIAQRGELPPLLPTYNNLRQENVFQPRRLYLQRQYQPKIRSTRNRMQTSSIDTTASSRDEDNSSITANGAVGGSGSIGIGSGWDVLEMKISERLSTLFFPELSDRQTFADNHLHAAQSTQRPMMSHMALAESLFWGHMNLPAEKKPQPKRYYRFPLKCLKKEIKISMDRLQLLALFDRDTNRCQVLAAILVGIFCSVLGATILKLGFYHDLYAFIFCFVMAGSQYSLLKSVQPDASSSTHGDDARYSRPIYFCLCTSILIFANHVSQNTADINYVTLFSIPFSVTQFLHGVKELMSIILLIFPILFSFGLFAQINTFLMYVLEQSDMHIFGGNAVCGLISAFLGIFKSILGCCILYGFAYGGLSEPRQTQHVLFSCFCALLVPTAYHLSRSASDFTYLWAIIKSSFVIHHDEDDELRQTTKLNKIEKNKSKAVNTSDANIASQEIKTSTTNIESNAQISIPSRSLESVAVNSIQDSAKKGTISSQCPPIDQNDDDLEDPLPEKLKSTVYSRLKNDFLVCTVIGAIVFSLHCSTIFTVLKPDLNPILQTFAIVVGFVLHYIIPQMRKYLPWLCFATPILKQNEFGLYESSTAAKIMWFERIFILLTFFEKNILLPLVFISALTADSVAIVQKFGIGLGSALVVLCGLKSIRSSYSDPASQYIVILFTVLFFKKDYRRASETFLIDYFVVSIAFKKICEFLLKLQFIVTYIAPWQITWGSAFHAFAQPFSVPHSAMLFLQAALSAILSTPLIPFLGSAIFLTSYVRPIKFWERDYNTRRIDHSNTRLSSQLERDLGADDNNLNSIFYEHLTRSLQHSLCGDLLMGRWGNVSQGDCFVLASDYLNCLVHIIELGNGLCTFQMRGLEFRGTYCQQREVEAISEGIGENEGCCCCSPGHLPNMLSVNAMFSTRWLAWQVVASQYILEGYSITDNLAQATLQVYEFRKVLITYYIKSIIYYTVRSPKLRAWLKMKSIQDALRPMLDRSFVDLDPIFNHNLDEDFDFRASGITRTSFCTVYMEWIQYCYSNRKENKKKQKQENEENQTKISANQQPRMQQMPTSENVESLQNIENKNISSRSFDSPMPSPKTSKDEQSQREDSKPTDETNEDELDQRSPLISLLLALSLLARRTLATATHTHSSLSGVEFLHGLHALFKGDYRIASIRDEWVFADMDLLHTVVAPAVKMSLKLHQDHFLTPDEFEDSATLFTAITSNTQLVISHEGDPLWRNSVLKGVKQLMALRHVMEDGNDEYRLIRLTKRFLSFRVIKLNRECVRGLWAGQQQELIYLRNRNPERGSIQNAKQALRNIINSSCDQPIGYPIYVSPLTTSYAETNEQLCTVIGGAITFEKVKNLTWKFCQHVRQRFSEGCSSGSATLDTEMGDIGVYYNAPASNNTISATTGATISYGSQNLSTLTSGAGNRGSMASVGKPNSSTLLAGFLIREREQERECMNSDRSNVSIYRKRSSVMNPKHEHERRSTFPSGSSPETSNAKDLPGFKTQMSPESSNCLATMSQSSPHPTTSRSHHPNSSFSSGNLCTRTVNRTLVISSDRKSKSEERQTSHDNDAFEPAMPDIKSILLARTSTSLPSHSNSPQLFETTTITTTASSVPLQPPRIPLNRKVIIVDAAEIYDCLDLGRRIDVIWPNERMRMAGGRSSWKDWEPSEGMVGYIVHYWQPSHPKTRFRSNFNRTLFLIQIGEHFVPVSESGVKEYNTIGTDDRFRNVAPILDVNLTQTDDVHNSNDSNPSHELKDETKAIEKNDMDDATPDSDSEI